MKVILFADNDADFLNARAEFLEKAGYQVLRAYTLEQARQQLSEARVHVAILDVRMEEDDDPRDISGLVLAKDPAYRVIPKIILTGRAHEYEIVREALRALPEGSPPAVDFVAKQEGPEVLIRAIGWAFAEHVRINWDLTIRWGRQNELSSPYLVSLVAPDLPREQLADRSAELEDVLRKLFYDYQQVTLGRILTRRPGWVLLTAFAYRPHGQEEQFVLAWGRREDILADRIGHESLPRATRRH
jgi:Response regulator containing CheY-like receiver, AAA-type ATPase, and DNA-binding domains